MTLGGELDLVLKPGRAQAASGGAVVEAEVEDVDRLGVSLGRVRVVGASGDLGGAIARIPEAVERATGERVVPTEVDAGLGGAVFRTAPESVRDREFYEVRTDGRETTVERWRAGDSGRARVPFTLTRRALEGLVDGVGGVVGGATG